ncbi:MAG TPA: cytochrome c oxidase subunit 3 [Myxococcaceae bacterium]|nr:cytochrome c oxidase subunit 3 [Myxococcaceae bacterium]
MTAPGVLLYRPPHARDEATARVGMLLFLGSWAMMFAGLFFALGVVRWRSPMWPPEEVGPLPVGWAALNTVLLVGSSLLLEMALRSVRSGRLGRMTAALGAALAVGVAFVASQVGLFVRMADLGLRWDAGAFGGAVFGLCGFHALHAAVGLVGLAAVLLAAGRGALQPGRHLRLRLWTQYWHFVGVVWLILFPAVFAGGRGG